MTTALPRSAEPRTVLAIRPSATFVETSAVQALAERAMAYLQAGYPMHFRGPAGTGKTTLAMHVAARLERPVMLMVGDEELSTSDLVGGQNGYRYRRVEDRFIHSVLKYEEDAVQRWVDNRLTVACRQGFTLVYDEFTRSRPEANNVLLTVLEEGVLVLPRGGQQESYIKVHPEFRVIFTSNPQEYAGVHAAQDALSDRLVTIDLDYYDRATEIEIVATQSGMAVEQAANVADIVRDFRDAQCYDQTPTLRASIMIARVSAQQGYTPARHDTRFVQVCLDVLESKTAASSANRERRAQQRELLLSIITSHSGR
ncbi:MAG: gas vesicle protein GvpN [Roseiflexaceae bacterium]|nr:gas vesicle protein GvpN [Roseiflexaceae bacterium]